MDRWTKIRLEVLRGERSKREILRREGIHWETLKKILEHSEPPGYRIETPRPKPKIGPYLERIAQIIKEDKALPKKQRHTAKRIYERIKEMGYPGQYTQVREAVREIKRVKQEVYMPLDHRAGEAQADFGYALAKVCGELRKVGFFVMVLPHSDVFLSWFLSVNARRVTGKDTCEHLSFSEVCPNGSATITAGFWSPRSLVLMSGS
jgi:transposase